MYKLGGDSAHQTIGQLKAELAAIKSRKPKGIMGYLEPFLENDEVQAQIAGGIMNLINGLAGKFLSAKAAPPRGDVYVPAGDPRGRSWPGWII